MLKRGCSEYRALWDTGGDRNGTRVGASGDNLLFSIT